MARTTSSFPLIFSQRAKADPCSQLMNEIMPMIYKRFTDKTAEEWRQIYKVSTLASDTGAGLTSAGTSIT